MSVIVLSLEDAPAVERVVLAAGADRLVNMSDAAFELLPAAEALLAAPHNEGRSGR
jgi:electron transfer flavoprotein alpha/beta subunit